MLFEIPVIAAYGGFGIFCFCRKGMWPVGIASFVVGALSAWAIWDAFNNSGDFGVMLGMGALVCSVVLSLPVLGLAVWCSRRTRGLPGRGEVGKRRVKEDSKPGGLL